MIPLPTGRQAITPLSGALGERTLQYYIISDYCVCAIIKKGPSEEGPSVLQFILFICLLLKPAWDKPPLFEEV